MSNPKANIPLRQMVKQRTTHDPVAQPEPRKIRDRKSCPKCRRNRIRECENDDPTTRVWRCLNSKCHAIMWDDGLDGVHIVNETGVTEGARPYEDED